MIVRKFKQHLSHKITKIILGMAVYVVFALYALPIYNALPHAYKTVHAFVSEKLLSNKRNIVVGGSTVLVDVADTQESRVKGLSGRENLPVRTGMLFIFEKPALYGFWMKDMKFAIDIIWFNEFGEIIYIVENAKPSSYPETFMPPTKALYVLEVPAGFSKKEGLKIGDKIDLY